MSNRPPDLYPQHPTDGEARRIMRETKERLQERGLWDAADLHDFEAELDPTRPEIDLLHLHADGHECRSGACLTTAGRRDFLCDACQLAQKDAHGHRYRPSEKPV
jgi:hypothetical protein